MPHHTHSQGTEGGIQANSQLVLHSVQTRIPVWGMAPLSIKMDLPISINIMKVVPYRHAQSPIFQVILHFCEVDNTSLDTLLPSRSPLPPHFLFLFSSLPPL